MAVDVVYAVVFFVAAVAPILGYRARNMGEAVIWSTIGAASSYALLTYAAAAQYGALFYLAGGLFLINVLELAMVFFAPLIPKEE